MGLRSGRTWGAACINVQAPHATPPRNHPPLCNVPRNREARACSAVLAASRPLSAAAASASASKRTATPSAPPPRTAAASPPATTTGMLPLLGCAARAARTAAASSVPPSCRRAPYS